MPHCSFFEGAEMLKAVMFAAFFVFSGCAARKVSVNPPPVTFQTETYIVVQTAPNNFTVLTRSKAAMEEIATRLGCDKKHVCANEWDGEVWRIQKLK
jgi:hypothetical protein